MFNSCWIVSVAPKVQFAGRHFQEVDNSGVVPPEVVDDHHSPTTKPHTVRNCHSEAKSCSNSRIDGIASKLKDLLTNVRAAGVVGDHVAHGGSAHAGKPGARYGDRQAACGMAQSRFVRPGMLSPPS